MTVEIVRRLKWEKGADAHHERAENVIADVEVEMGVPSAHPADEPVQGVGGFRWEHVKLGTLLHAAKDEVDADAAPTNEPLVVRADLVFFLDARLRPRDRHAVSAREGFDPRLVLSRPLDQHLFRDGCDAVHVAEEVHDVLRPGQQREIALNDDPVATVVYQRQQAAKQLVEGLHWSSPRSCAATRSCVRRLVGTRSCDHWWSTGTTALDAPRVSITKGSALEISALPTRSTASRPRDFKGGALGYS